MKQINETGANSYRKLGLSTTQVSNETVIATNRI